MKSTQREGFTLLEIVPVLTIVAFLLTIVIVAVNPIKQLREARNTIRKNDINLIADAIAERLYDDKKRVFFARIPTGAALEICGDTFTGSCVDLFDIRDIVDQYLIEIPLDPLSEDTDAINEHTRYFINRSGVVFTITAPDTEPSGAEVISITR